MDGCHSSSSPVTSGVLQGTVLGPLLFLLFINDLPLVLDPTTKCRLFADDCLVYREIHNLEDQIKLQEELNALECWSIQWGMHFNAKSAIQWLSQDLPLSRKCINWITPYWTKSALAPILVWKSPRALDGKNMWIPSPPRPTHAWGSSEETLRATRIPWRGCPMFHSFDPHWNTVLLYGIHTSSKTRTHWNAPRDEQLAGSIETTTPERVSQRCYVSCGWTPLENRWNTSSLTMMFKVLNRHVGIPPVDLGVSLTSRLPH